MNPEIQNLADQFKKLELHAARGGREVRRALLAAIDPKVHTGSYTTDLMLRILQAEISELIPALPPYAPPIRSMNELLVGLEHSIQSGMDADQAFASINDASERRSDPDEKAGRITQALMEILPKRPVIYTHTLSETVLNIIQILYSKGRIKKIIVTESRPNLDGRVTVERLALTGIPVYLTIDAAMPAAIAAADLMLTGAEAIDGNGQVIGKVGAFPAAVFCRMVHKPVYVVADASKLFPLSLAKLTFMPLSSDIFPEGGDGWLPFGSYFDVTPGEYIQAYVNDLGALSIEEISALVRDLTVSPWLSAKFGM